MVQPLSKVEGDILSTTVCALFSEVAPVRQTNQKRTSRPPGGARHDLHLCRKSFTILRWPRQAPRARRARGGVSAQSRPSPHSGASRCVPSAHHTPHMKRLSTGVRRATLTVTLILDCASAGKKKAHRQPVHDVRVLYRLKCVASHLNAIGRTAPPHPRTARALIKSQWMVVAGALSVDGEATSTFLCAAPPRPRARPSAPSLRPSRRPSAGLQEPRGRQQRARSRSPTRARSVHMCVRRDPSPLRRMPAPRPKRHPLSRRRCGGERRREGAA